MGPGAPLAEPVKRVECFDISHTMGEATVASCVVFDAAGPVRAQYRRYNISGIEPGDDYAAMHQAIDRRFRRAVEGKEARSRATGSRADERPRAMHEGRMGDFPILPDVLLIDGGAGQLAQAQAALADLGVEGVLLVGVAKGVERRAGHEALVLPDGRELRPGAASLTFSMRIV